MSELIYPPFIDTKETRRTLSSLVYSELPENEPWTVMNFDGVLMAELPDLAALKVPDFKIECEVIETLDTGSDIIYLADYRNASTNLGFLLFGVQGGAATFRIYTGSTAIAASAPNAFTNVIGAKHTLIATLIDGQILLDFDGVLAGTSAVISWAGTLWGLALNGNRQTNGTLIPGAVPYTMPRFDYYELDTAGNETKHLIHATGSGRNGEVFFNSAPDRPANSQFAVTLGGSSDGAQRQVDSANGSRHNWEYGANLVGGFDGQLSFESQTIPAITDLEKITIEFIALKDYLGDDVGSYESLFIPYISGIQSVYECVMVSLGNLTGQLTGETITLLHGPSQSWRGITNVVSKGYHKIELVYNSGADRYDIYLDEIIGNHIEYTWTATGRVSFQNPIIGTRWHSSARGNFLTDNVYRVEAETLGGTERFNWNFGDLENGVVPNSGIQQSYNDGLALVSNGSYAGREEVDVPADLGNPLVDVYGQPITDKSQSNLFKRTKAYIRA